MPALRSTPARRTGPRAGSDATTMTTVAARAALADIVNRAAFGKERIVLTRHGKPLVAVVPFEDVEALEAAEDAADLVLLRKARAEWAREGRKGTPLAEVAAELGIKLRR